MVQVEWLAHSVRAEYKIFQLYHLPLFLGFRSSRKGANSRLIMTDNRRKWMWLFLAVLAALQLYAVRELLAAFALFVLGFGAIALCIGVLYFFQKAWEAGVARVAASQHGLILAVRRSVAAIEDLGRRPMRRPDSEPAR
jgi:hypothetical protein